MVMTCRKHDSGMYTTTVMKQFKKYIEKNTDPCNLKSKVWTILINQINLRRRFIRKLETKTYLLNLHALSIVRCVREFVNVSTL